MEKSYDSEDGADKAAELLPRRRVDQVFVIFHRKPKVSGDIALLRLRVVQAVAHIIRNTAKALGRQAERVLSSPLRQ